MLNQQLRRATSATAGLSAFAIGAGCLLLGSAGLADSPPVPASGGNVNEGELRLSLNPGGVVPPEIVVPVLPDCDSKAVDLKIRWSHDDNKVKIRAKGDHVLAKRPTVSRTLGVDYVPNPFFQQPKDIVAGRYQFWIISPSRLLTFYYDGATLNLLGSDLDFATQPANSVAIQIPSLKMIGSDFFQPDKDGNLDFEWDIDYDHMVRGDRSDLAHLFFTFPPPNLCQINPFRLDQSTLRPYTSAPLPAAAAQSWSDWDRNGMVFDITIEPATTFLDPPTFTNFGSYSGGTLIAGAIPKGWSMDIDAAFMNIAPPIRAWGGAGTCASFYKDHVTGNNFCPPPGP